MKMILNLSGGMDSATLLYDLLEQGHDVGCLAVDYGQRHVKEISAAGRIAVAAEERCGRVVPFFVADLSGVREMIANSSQTSDEPVPEGHYAEENMKKTVVPNRNMILLSLAIGWAVSERADAVAYAAHAGDHTVYPDCRPEFVDAMRAAARLCDWHPVQILSPYERFTKAEICRRGHELGVPFGMTWSCYQGGEIQCGRCGTCVERAACFVEAGVYDPTKYESPDFWKTVTAPAGVGA